jgi:hypothetical protein
MGHGCWCCLQDSYYESTKASKFTHAGFSPAVVNLALAYHAAERGDDSQVGRNSCFATAAAVAAVSAAFFGRILNSAYSGTRACAVHGQIAVDAATNCVRPAAAHMCRSYP